MIQHERLMYRKNKNKATNKLITPFRDKGFIIDNISLID